MKGKRDNTMANEDKARAVREQLEALRTARVEREEAANALARDEIALRDEIAMQEHGEPVGERGLDWQIVSVPDGCCIVKKPAALIYKRHFELKSPTAVNVQNLVTSCLVWPSQREFLELVEKRPAILTLAGGEVLALAGHSMKALEGK
jgi:hypothetical protein